MSDTPRTDKFKKTHYDEMCDDEFEYVELKFAESLEREADQLAKQCVKNVEEIGELRAALVISEKKELATRAVIKSWKEDEGADAARLDWLVDRNEAEFRYRGTRYGITREEIDEAMEEHNDER